MTDFAIFWHEKQFFNENTVRNQGFYFFRPIFWVWEHRKVSDGALFSSLSNFLPRYLVKPLEFSAWYCFCLYTFWSLFRFVSFIFSWDLLFRVSSDLPKDCKLSELVFDETSWSSPEYPTFCVMLHIAIFASKWSDWIFIGVPIELWRYDYVMMTS